LFSKANLDSRYALDNHSKSIFTAYSKSMCQEGYLTSLLKELLCNYIKKNKSILLRLVYNSVL